METRRLRIILAALIVTSYVATFTGAMMMGIRIDVSSFVPILAFIVAMTVFLNAYAKWRSLPRLTALGDTIFGGIALVIPVLIATYLAMRANKPLADETLVALDVMVGFNWRAFVDFIDGHPYLATALGVGYQSFTIQLICIPLLLCVLRQEPRAYIFIISYALIGFVSSIVAIWFPALGTYVVYAVGQDELKNIHAHFAYFFLDQFHAVRNDPDFVLSLDGAAGILTFPSVHAAVAYLCAWATWSIRWLRWPSLCLNLLMATSAISHANHYFVDVLAAVPITAFCIVSTCWLARPRRELRARQVLGASPA